MRLHDDILALVGVEADMAGGMDGGAYDHAAEPLVVGRQVGASAAETDAQRRARDDHGQLVSVSGVIISSWTAEPRGTETA